MPIINKDDIDYFAEKGCRAAVGIASMLLAEKDADFMLMYADIGCRFSADVVLEKYPNKCIQSGIAEQNMIGVAAAMANEGFHVFAVAYGPFITARVLDQIRVNLGIMESPVILIGLGAGLIMSDLGPSSTALEDIAHIRSIPNITVISPADSLETIKAMQALADYNKPTYLRITASLNSQIVYPNDYEFVIGKAIQLKEGSNTAIIATGTIIYQCLEAAKILDEIGISCSVINMHTIKPLDVSALDKLMDYKAIFTIEEHNIIGGLGGAVAEYFAEKKCSPQLKRIGISDEFFNADSYSVIIERYGLSAKMIAQQIADTLKKEELHFEE